MNEEASAEQKAIVDAAIDALLTTGLGHDTPEGPLFHYTSAGAFLHIMESKQIWATHFAHTNDHEELRAGEALIDDETNRLASHDTDPFFRRLVVEFRGVFETMRFSNATSVFVACFSSEADRLSQWRGYGGVSRMNFGLSRFHLPPEGRPAKGAKLFVQGVWCEYSPDAFRKRVRAEIGEIHEVVWNQYVRHGVSAWDDPGKLEFVTRIRRATFLRLAPLAIRYKNEYFGEEAEWRLAAIPVGDDQSTVRFRAGSAGLVPYVPLDLCGAPDEPLPLASVTIGPGEPPESEAGMKMFLAQKGFSPDIVTRSRIPFRGF